VGAQPSCSITARQHGWLLYLCLEEQAACLDAHIPGTKSASLDIPGCMFISAVSPRLRAWIKFSIEHTHGIVVCCFYHYRNHYHAPMANTAQAHMVSPPSHGAFCVLHKPECGSLTSGRCLNFMMCRRDECLIMPGALPQHFMPFIRKNSSSIASSLTNCAFAVCKVQIVQTLASHGQQCTCTVRRLHRV